VKLSMVATAIIVAVLLFISSPLSATILYVSIHTGTINGNPYSGLVKVDTTTGQITTLPKTAARGPADSLSLFPSGRYIVYDVNLPGRAELRVYDLETTNDLLIQDFLTFAPLSSFTQGSEPQDLIIEPGGAAVLVSHYSGNMVTRTELTAPYLTTVVVNDTRSKAPEGIAFDGAGNFFMLAGFNSSPCGIYKYSYDSTTHAATYVTSNVGFDNGGGVYACSLDGLTWDTYTGQLYATSAFSGVLWRIDPVTLQATQIGTLPHVGSAVGGPDGVVSDGRGKLYIASRGGTITSGGTNYIAQAWTFNLATNLFASVADVSGIDDLSPLPVDPPSVVKQFTSHSLSRGTSTTLTFTLTNPNTNSGLTGIAFLNNPDTLPAGLTATPIPATTACGGTFQVTTTAVSFTGGSLAAGTSCTLPSITVTGTAVGVQQNCVTVTSLEGGQSAQSCDSLTVTIVDPPTLAKSFNPTSIVQNQTTTALQFVLTNPNSFPLTNTAFTDAAQWPSGLQVSPTAQTITLGPATISCTSGTLSGTLTITGGNSISLTGATLSGGATCTFPVPALTVNGIATGNQVNTTSIVTSTEAPIGNAATASVNVTGPPPKPPVILKKFGSSSIAVNGNTTITFTITNPNAGVALSGLFFTDPLPADLQAVPVSGTACGGGTYSATQTSISLQNGSLAAGGTCTIQVTVTGIAQGSDTNCVTIYSTTVDATTGNQSCDSITIGAVAFFQVRYASNLDQGDSYVNITNTGVRGGDPVGRICANAYVFDPNEEMVACCSCMVTPNGVKSFSVVNDLISNPLTPNVPKSVVIKLLSTAPDANGTCDAAAPTGDILASGLRAWGTSLHALPTFPTTYGITETPFSIADLSVTELKNLTLYCGAIQRYLGGGYGICRKCRTTALGATPR
jgi:hypothetical protein